MASPAHQPTRFKFSFRELATLPARICSPPEPTVGKVRSLGVTPVYQVQLEDVLDRKHLPPLGLKDFEEWLLFVEQAPENLYFVLWLKEYTIRYNRWINQSKADRQRNSRNKIWTEYNGQLAIFFNRARQTFFNPNSEFALNLTYEQIETFYNARSSHPDPAMFHEISIEAHNVLRDSLKRFVVAAYSNVGTRRAVCGIVVGTFVMLLGSVIPLATTIMLVHSRWVRLTALPGTWLGLTIMLASLHGVCLSVYVFGDVRQLRKFELNPATPKPRPSKPEPIAPPAPFQERASVNVPKPAEITIMQPAPGAPSPPPSDRFSVLSMDTFNSESSDSTSDHDASDSIVISPEYYDENPIEGPATSPMRDAYPHHMISLNGEKPKRNYHSFLGTATFIHPYSGQYEELASDDDMEREDVLFGYRLSPPTKKGQLPEECQIISEFNFDELPMRSESSLGHAPASIVVPAPPAPVMLAPSEAEPSIDLSTHSSASNAFAPVKPKTNFTPKRILGEVQNKCSRKKWRWYSPGSGKEPIYPTEPEDEKKERIYKNFTLARAVPAFASPLTRVLSPVVKRAQWEVVVRSSIYAFLLACCAIGALLAVPAQR